jgi:hypothetical protein
MPVNQQGQEYPLTAYPGYSLNDALTSSSGADLFVVPGTSADSQYLASPTPVATSSTTPNIAPANYAYYIVAIILLLGVLKFATEHEKSDMDPKFVGIGVYNFFAVGIMSMLFLVIGKVAFAKYPVPGISQIIAAA